ncbi:hypothetical protein GCM10023189_30340 [Nibrella saemangeumensis]|uniref:Uncharacterized protein n=1 Tax=Nibrella saemangeumensis TaxID=1084526 RepID=A0ABP8MYK8_9BACT
MKKKDLQNLIKTHEALYARAKTILDEHYAELEAQDKHMQWVKEWLKQKEILEWLRQQKPDDE